MTHLLKQKLKTNKFIIQGQCGLHTCDQKNRCKKIPKITTTVKLLNKWYRIIVAERKKKGGIPLKCGRFNLL